MKKGFAANLEEETRKNTDFRRVLYTGKYSQLVLMCLKPNEDIGEETHDKDSSHCHEHSIFHMLNQHRS